MVALETGAVPEAEQEVADEARVPEAEALPEVAGALVDDAPPEEATVETEIGQSGRSMNCLKWIKHVLPAH